MTHGITYLPRVDRIVVLVGGRISEVGTYEQLISFNGAFAEFIRNYLTETAEDDDENEDPEGTAMTSHISQPKNSQR